MRRIVESVVDQGSFFEVAPLYGRSVITGYARLDGWPVALMASDPYFYGGAWPADTCQKVERFLDIAQTFHLPVVYLVWLIVVLVGYPICRWYAGVKQRRRDLWWLSYL